MRIRGRAHVSVFLAGLLLAFAGTGPAAAATLEEVALKQGAGEAILAVTSDEAIRYKVLRQSRPDRICLDLIGYVQGIEPRVSGTDPSGWLSSVQHTVWKNGSGEMVVRYAIETTSPADYTVQADGGKLALTLRASTVPPPPTGPQNPPAADAPVQQAPAQSPAPQAPAASPTPAEAQTSQTTTATAPSAEAQASETTAAAPTAEAPKTTATEATPAEAQAPEAPSERAPSEPAVQKESAPSSSSSQPPAARKARKEAPLDTAPTGRSSPSFEVSAMEMGQNTPSKPASGGAPMSIDVQGADIRTVLRSIAEFSKVNIIPDRDVTGAMNVKLVNVPWRQALELVCESAGLAAVDHDGVIRVATKKTLTDEDLERESAARKREELLPLVTAILPIRYANAEELKTSVSFVLTKRGSIEVDSRTNSLLVTDITDRVDQVRQMVTTLDTETMQVEIVAKLVDVDASVARLLGIRWNVNITQWTGDNVTAEVDHNSPILNPTTEVRVGVIKDFAAIDAALQALERNNKANIISNPSITTVNNRRARILVGKQIPLIVLDQAGNPITELKKVGITLEVTPYINSDEMITMDLHPEVSDLSTQSTVQGGIVFTTTEADTRVMVGDGETAVIGGLIRTGETRFHEGIPILSSIPVFGALFRSSDTRHERRELLIFVTPRIVRGMASQEERQEEEER